MLAQAAKMNGDIEGALEKLSLQTRSSKNKRRTAHDSRVVVRSRNCLASASHDETRCWVERGRRPRAQLVTLTASNSCYACRRLASLLGEYEKAEQYGDEASRLIPESATPKLKQNYRGAERSL